MTYLYETLPANEGDSVEQFEVQQSLNELPLTQHPQTGVPVRRVILGGWGVFAGDSGSQTDQSCCTPGSGCC